MGQKQNNLKLLNGQTIPYIGFGTWQIENGSEAVNAVKDALSIGYRHIDTASVYGNEESVGIAIKESLIPREEIFVTSKLWNDDQGYDKTLQAFEKTMKLLGLDYLDLYLIHWPKTKQSGDNYQQLNKDTWKAFEKLYEEGRIKAIGCSNFMVEHLQNIMESANVQPMVDQIECSPCCAQDEMISFCKKHKIIVEAWSPLARGKCFGQPILKKLSEKYHKSEAQIILRWLWQREVVALPKSTHLDRMKSNADILDFSLSENEMNEIHKLESLGRTGRHPDKAYY